MSETRWRWIETTVEELQSQYELYLLNARFLAREGYLELAEELGLRAAKIGRILRERGEEA